MTSCRLLTPRHTHELLWVCRYIHQIGEKGAAMIVGEYGLFRSRAG